MKGVVCVALCGVVLMCVYAASAVEMNGPPVRPVAFHNPQELRDYLKALNDYYAIVGRPRFGRSADSRSETEYTSASIKDGNLAA
ncbi:hypothetical protein LSAT2_017080 [Lamellibrachia satsuma]|nr:hypothetical protein LSAT2_017080 [Lamellibrachia satsuma]